MARGGLCPPGDRELGSHSLFTMTGHHAQGAEQLRLPEAVAGSFIHSLFQCLSGLRSGLSLHPTGTPLTLCKWLADWGCHLDAFLLEGAPLHSCLGGAPSQDPEAEEQTRGQDWLLRKAWVLGSPSLGEEEELPSGRAVLLKTCNPELGEDSAARSAGHLATQDAALGHGAQGRSPCRDPRLGHQSGVH